MSRLRARVAKLDGAEAVHTWQVWYVDDGAWTNESEHSGMVFTEAEVAALPVPPGVGRVIVVYEDMSPDQAKAPECDA